MVKKIGSGVAQLGQSTDAYGVASSNLVIAADVLIRFSPPSTERTGMICSLIGKALLANCE